MLDLNGMVSWSGHRELNRRSFDFSVGVGMLVRTTTS
jgi:hypothetical protein